MILENYKISYFDTKGNQPGPRAFHVISMSFMIFKKL